LPSKESDFLSTAVSAARLSAELIIENLDRLSESDISLKQTSDFVTRIDKESEEIIIRTIKGMFPDHFFLSEESMRETFKEHYRWIIDPLDGTTNYIHGYPVFAVSIALEWKGEIVLGVVLDPIKDELFTAEKEKGAFLNELPLEVSAIASFKDCLITTGFPFREKNMIDLYLKAFRNIFLKASGLRRAGSAALDLAYLAAGRCDGFFELGLSPWDIAAGSILIKEAGGVITDFSGGGEYMSTGNIVAGNSAIQVKILEEIKNVFGGIIDV
jgi:myo-inositol-1(or 4)-monophosphatase